MVACLRVEGWCEQTYQQIYPLSPPPPPQGKKISTSDNFDFLSDSMRIYTKMMIKSQGQNDKKFPIASQKFDKFT